MATSFQTTDLDFDAIKSNLKTYLEQKSEFTDYNWEASGLNNILDVLAYNTHFNALQANFALNEAYLTSAQLRSSVVNIAQSIGYKIRSRSASVANLNLTLNLIGAAIKPASITLPLGTKFTTSVDGVSYTFQTRATCTASNTDGLYTFTETDGSTNISIYEGISRTKTFIVQGNDERQIFVIPDNTIDTTTTLVSVYDTYSSTQSTSYIDISGVTSVNASTPFYKIIESPNGYYEMNFGDGMGAGLKPSIGNKIVVEYLSCVGAEANGATSFTPVSQVTVNGNQYSLGVTMSAASHAGASRQSIESIRANAPLGFAAQNRLVTAEDYKTTILSKYAAITDVVAWGGEDNDPPNYGVVYLGLLFADGVSTASKTIMKNQIQGILNENLAILSIDIAFVEPIITYLEITTTFAFNPNLTGVTLNSMESQVQAAVIQYVEDNLTSFSGSFRKSNLSTIVDDISLAVLSSEIGVRLQQRLIPITTATTDDTSQTSAYDIVFPVALSSPDDVNHIITSTSFTYAGAICSLKNELNSTKIQIIDRDNNVIVDNIGSYAPSTGRVQLNGFAPGVITSGDAFIKVSAVPLSSNSIVPLRNYYLDIDPSISTANAIIDRQNTRA